MLHSREDVIERAVEEFEPLDRILGGLSDALWQQPLRRAAGEDPWTVKDAVAHITYWKADVGRFARGERRQPDVRRQPADVHNHVIYERWRDRSAQDVLAWHRQVHDDVMAALSEAPEAWFSGSDRRPEWPYDLQGHSALHRMEIERALAAAADARGAAPDGGR
jgi:hypothetical protein